MLAQAQVEAVRTALAHRGAPSRSASGPDAIGASAPEGDYRGAWYWEGNVQAAVVRQLESEGWRIVRTADARTRERGDDIRAEREGVTLVV